jgi:hypothetical protein
MITTYERGILHGQRQLALLQLETKFGPLPSEIKQRLESLSSDQLRQLSMDLLKAQSLQELGLQD